MKVAEDITTTKISSNAKLLNGISTKELEETKSKFEKAFLNNEFTAFFQPITNIKTGRILGYEALARWNTSDKKLRNPAEFIKEAEFCGKIVPLTEIILRNACTQGKLMIGLGYSDISMSINISSVLFDQTDLVQMTEKILKETGFSAKNLIFEIKSFSTTQNKPDALLQISSLRKMGIKIAIDNYGVEFSPHVIDLPIDMLKIDKSFLIAKHQTKEHTKSVKALFSVAFIMDYQIIAETVETREELEEVSKLGCNGIQGYLTTEPAPIEEVIKTLIDNKGVFISTEKA